MTRAILAQPGLVHQAPLGAGLLPPRFCADLRDELSEALAVAYSAVHRSRTANHLEWQNLRGLFAKLRESYEELGLEAPPLAWDALWKRVDLNVPDNDGVTHSRLVMALATDYGPRFSQHLRYRHAHNGNVHIRCRGPTGSGKSSCLIAVMDWIKPIEPARLVDHLAFDVHELPRKLSAIGPGHGVLLDELVTTTGEGSRASSIMLDNMEDTLRASQRDLFIASPGKSEHSTMQAELECIAWDPARRYSLFLVWVEAIPMGVIAIPWCSPAHYAAYDPWKADKVRRSLSGQFNDNDFAAKAVMQLFDNPRVVEFLDLAVNKPTMADFNNVIVRYWPAMLTTSQVERIARIAHLQCSTVQRIETRYGKDGFEAKFEWFFGVTPNKGFLTVAGKFYEE